MTFDIITIFPHIFDSYFNESILKIAQQKKLVNIKIHNLRDYTKDKHKKVDDRPYGGGPGMIFKVEPVYKALKKMRLKGKKTPASPRLGRGRAKVLMLDPAGKTFDQKMAQKFSKLDRIVLLCGRYEGFDHRVTKLVDERISVGDYILSGGELPAMVVVEAVTRLLPGVLGCSESIVDETFAQGKEDYVKYPQYTRPEDFQGKKVPKVLLSGNHAKIKEWREKYSKKK